MKASPSMRTIHGVEKEDSPLDDWLSVDVALSDRDLMIA
jgi:hypothetical protein